MNDSSILILLMVFVAISVTLVAVYQNRLLHREPLIAEQDADVSEIDDGLL